jgi:hypothetical protein
VLDEFRNEAGNVWWRVTQVEGSSRLKGEAWPVMPVGRMVAQARAELELTPATDRMVRHSEDALVRRKDGR